MEFLLNKDAFISGTNPRDLRGCNTGVFMGIFTNEAQELLTADPHQISGYEFIGSLRTMLANRVSYHFDFHGILLLF